MNAAGKSGRQSKLQSSWQPGKQMSKSRRRRALSVRPERRPNVNVYEIITDRIVKQLESGVAPWRKPWSAKLPVNLMSQKPYRGLNVLTLASQGYPSRFWLTFNQANKLGGKIRKGEKSSPVIYWNVGEEREYTTRDGQTRVSTISHSCFAIQTCSTCRRRRALT
jgi:antirestriction protein ArdC